MIVSYKYKFIFIKTRKTAGTSIEAAVSQHLGARDIVTPFAARSAGHRPRNFVICINGQKKRLFAHMPALLVKKVVGDAVFDSFFKFCVEREPVDKTISHYSYLKNSNEKIIQRPNSWEDYLSNEDFPIDYNLYTDGEQVLVDRIIKFETLRDEIREIFKSLNLPLSAVPPVARTGLREKLTPTTDQIEGIYHSFTRSNFFTGYQKNQAKPLI